MTVRNTDPFTAFGKWLAWLDSHDGRLYRREKGQAETDDDWACAVPTPPGSSIITIGDIRTLVESGKRLKAAEDQIQCLQAALMAAEARAHDLQQAIELHHSQRADDRCWMDDDRLYAAADLPPCDRAVGDREAMLKNCAKFIERRLKTMTAQFDIMETALSARCELLETLVAWQHEDVSEGQVCRITGSAPVDVREAMEAAIAAVLYRLEKPQSCEPPSPPSEK